MTETDDHVPWWEPGNPTLRGDSVDDHEDGFTVTHTQRLDELAHRERRERGLANEYPDPGYDFDAEDQRPAAVHEVP